LITVVWCGKIPPFLEEKLKKKLIQNQSSTGPLKWTDWQTEIEVFVMYAPPAARKRMSQRHFQLETPRSSCRRQQKVTAMSAGSTATSASN